MVNLTQTAIVQDIKILGMGFPCQTLANLITFFLRLFSLWDS